MCKITDEKSDYHPVVNAQNTKISFSFPDSNLYNCSKIAIIKVMYVLLSN